MLVTNVEVTLITSNLEFSWSNIEHIMVSIDNLHSSKYHYEPNDFKNFRWYRTAWSVSK